MDLTRFNSVIIIIIIIQIETITNQLFPAQGIYGRFASISVFTLTFNSSTSFLFISPTYLSGSVCYVVREVLNIYAYVTRQVADFLPFVFCARWECYQTLLKIAALYT